MKRALFRVPEIAFFLTVNAAAIRLPIHAQFPRLFNAGFPSFSKVLIIKGHTHRFSHSVADGPDLIVVLKAAVKQGGAEPVEFAFFGILGGRKEPIVVAVCAALALPEGNIANECLHFIAGLDNQF